MRDWQEAVHLTGQLLVDKGSVAPSYVDAMERVLRDLGPYAVIAPGIVLLHARPQAWSPRTVHGVGHALHSRQLRSQPE